MNVYQKLNQARELFHQQKLKKSGLNKFAGYQYFELGDFIIPALRIFNEVGLNAFISFGRDIAMMHIVNVDKPDEIIMINSPMSEAALKGCHPVQNLGAVQTYLRRYLWVAALEIVEHDALDATTGRKGDAPIITPRGKQEIDEERKNVIFATEEAIYERMDKDDMIGAYEEYIGITDPDEKLFLWGLLNSKTRSAIKKHGDSLKQGN